MRQSAASCPATTPEEAAPPAPTLRNTHPFPEPGRHKVAVLVRHGLLPMELGIPHRLLGNARDAAGHSLYTVATCAAEPGPVRTDADFTVEVTHGPEALDEADTVIVPAAHEDDGTGSAGRLSPQLAALFARIRPGARVASICTGAFALAAAGLLDGRRATTHWQAAPRLQRLFPRIRVDPDVLYVEDGGVLTSAGVASGVDLCLHLVREDFGGAVANDVARRTVVPPHRDGGQAQFVEAPMPPDEDSSTGAAREWALRHLDRPVSLRELADRESMSVRTFTRRFRAEVGTSPQQWITAQRLLRARQLLESTDAPVERVAVQAGFGTPDSLRQHFHTSLGVSPSAYRRTFRESTPTEHAR
ncbi:GlxA family transcriptional regulator [Streptomyces sulphureus]|uniref:GlxA family transcriptional regulator n=1 Tax=Streptomyces sulphureus TaxID=47758 RepID=UPI0003642F2D|nr:helix-turn-helix domain-containing protein [Streptomyces sulphureus]